MKPVFTLLQMQRQSITNSFVSFERQPLVALALASYDRTVPQADYSRRWLLPINNSHQ